MTAKRFLQSIRSGHLFQAFLIQALFLPLILGSCAPAGYLYPVGYGRKDFQGMGVVVVALPQGSIDSLSLPAFRTLFQVDSAKARTALADTFNFFFANLIRDSASMVKPRPLAAQACDSECRTYTHGVPTGDQGGRKLEFKVPDSARIFQGGSQMRYALFTQNLVFSDSLQETTFRANGGMMVGGYEGGASRWAPSLSENGEFVTKLDRTLDMSVEYLVWDYWKANSVVAGVAHYRVPAADSIYPSDWRWSVRQAALLVLNQARWKKRAN